VYIRWFLRLAWNILWCDALLDLPRGRGSLGKVFKTACELGWQTFFAATVGFGVPKVATGEGQLLNSECFGRGCILFLVSVIGKSFLAPFALPLTITEASKFSFAMQGRGEFSFLIADQAAEDNIYSGSDFGAVVWGLLLTCIITPFGFRYVLTREMGEERSTDPEDDGIQTHWSVG